MHCTELADPFLVPRVVHTVQIEHRQLILMKHLSQMNNTTFFQSGNEIFDLEEWWYLVVPLLKKNLDVLDPLAAL